MEGGDAEGKVGAATGRVYLEVRAWTAWSGHT